jgi:hypothetical protein
VPSGAHRNMARRYGRLARRIAAMGAAVRVH